MSSLSQSQISLAPSRPTSTVIAVLCVLLTLSTASLWGRDTPTTVKSEHMVPMRDGVRLATTVYRPAGDGPFPVVLSRTPYGRQRGGERSSERYVENGYAYVIQDQRGRFDSEGEYTPHENEIEDGYDTVEWAGTQAWSTGKVGMTGGSALGIAANLAAAANPPHLVAAYVIVAPQSLFYEGRFVGGMFKEADTGNWMRGQGVAEEAIREYKKRVVLDDRWQQTDLIFLRHHIDIPIYNVGGWYDLFSHGSVSNFQFLQQSGRKGARGRQKLLMGPFGHGLIRGDLEYPGAGERRRNEDEIRWFDYWLKGIENGIMNEPPVTYYQMAAARIGSPSAKNGYRTAETWPPQGVEQQRFYLHAGLTLNTEPPVRAQSSTAYIADPAEPVPTVGGLNLTLPLGPMDQREIGERDDYLRFQTAPLTEELTIAGKLDFELWAASDGPDTDFIVKLVDVYPDGYEALVLDTGIRARYRHGRRAEDVAMLEPGEPTRLDVDMWHTAITFEKGHRVAVHIASSNYPRFEVNPNTGEAPGGDEQPPRIAHNAVLHESAHPSALLLPVLARP